MEQHIDEVIKRDDEVSIKDILLKIRSLFRYLFSKWVLIVTFGILGSLIGFYYAYKSNPLYTASTTFVLEDEKQGGGLSSLAGLASMAGVDIGSSGGGIFQGDNILELYKSRTMIQKTLLTTVEFSGKHELLINYYIEFNDLRNNWSKNDKLKNLKFRLEDSTNYHSSYASKRIQLTRIQDSILTGVIDDINKNYLTVSKPDKKLNIIKVDVKGENELFSAYFNREIVKNVNDFYVETKTRKSLDNIYILQSKTDSVRAVMNGAIYSAAAVSDATPNLNPTRQVQRIAPVQRSQFTAETNKQVLAGLLQNLEMAKMSLLKERPLIQVIDEPVFPLTRVKIGKIHGLVYGGIVGGIICIFFLLLRRSVAYVKSL